jgi:hypothetical protein
MKLGSREFRRFTWSGSPGRARMSGPESTECYRNAFQAPHRAHSANNRDAGNSAICKAGEGGVGAHP